MAKLGENEKEKNEQRRLGEYVEGLFPNSTRTTNQEISGHEIVIYDTQDMGDYYVVAANDMTDQGREISFGTATAQTGELKRFLHDGGELPQTVKIGERTMGTPKFGRDTYYVFEDV